MMFMILENVNSLRKKAFFMNIQDKNLWKLSISKNSQEKG